MVKVILKKMSHQIIEYFNHSTNILKWVLIIFIVLSWTSKGFSNESIKPPITSDNSLTPVLNCYGTKTKVSFDMSCLKQDKITFNQFTLYTK